jgi:hypothetical protein
LGQGKAPKEAYEVARRAASALLSGNKSAAVFSPVNKVDLESWMVILNAINPQIYRLGGGREEPDGSVSFLVRFAGRDQGITGELYVRLEERRPPPPREAVPPPPVNETEIGSQAEDDSAILSADVPAALPIEENQTEEQAAAPLPEAVPAADIPVVQIWHFEDLILEEARNREEENKEDRHRFDFTPYHRFF